MSLAKQKQKHSCVVCARRKVKCDKLSPCLKCSKAQVECIYRSPAPSQRHRKRLGSGELLSKIGEYEELLHRHNIPFHPLDNSWIPSPLETKLISAPPTPSALPDGIDCSPPQLSETELALNSQPAEETTPEFLICQSGVMHRWFSLPKELRESSIEQFKRFGKWSKDDTEESNSSSFDSHLLLIPVQLVPPPRLIELHPQPKFIFKLWQAFIERVNPLTKIIHIPTLQQRILEVFLDLESVTRPLEAVMFAMYALAIRSMRGTDCVEVFGETKAVLLDRYRSAAAQALIAAGLHNTRDLDVLQALVLFVLLDCRSEFAEILIGIAVRIGNKMGLHLTGTDPQMPFFEQEMRIRIWWLIMGLETRIRRKTLRLTIIRQNFGDVRLPLNVNDSELHPQMTARPVEHEGATEMLYCMMKYEAVQHIRAWLNLHSNSNRIPHELVSPTRPTVAARRAKLLKEIKQIYLDKHSRNLDLSIPLHQVTATAAELSFHRGCLWCFHPHHHPDDGQHMSPAEQDAVFESSIEFLRLHRHLRSMPFSLQLLEDMTSGTQAPALIYLISELRHRVSGELVRAGWAQVATSYEEWARLMHDDSPFCTALADLTLEAWEARWREREAQQEPVPAFIQALQAARGDLGAQGVTEVDGLISESSMQFAFTSDDLMDWAYWDESSQPFL